MSPRKRTVSSVKRCCDVAWSRIVRARAGGRCERCGGPAHQAHHVYGRRNHRLRFEPANGVALCYACHRKVHDEPVPWTYRWGMDRTDDAAFCMRVHQELVHRTFSDYLELEAELKALLAEHLEEAA